MFLMYPLTYPLATTLDKLFGAHSTLRFQKNELKALIELHEITDYTHDKRVLNPIIYSRVDSRSLKLK